MQIASIAAEVKVRTWPDGQLLHSYKSNEADSMRSISWSKDGAWLALVPSKGRAEVISVKENLKRLHCIEEIQQPTYAVFENSTKRNIALASATGLVLIYDIKSRCVKKHFPRARSAVFKIAYCANDSFLIAACENGEIVLYNNNTNNTSALFTIPKGGIVTNVRFHQTKKNIFAAGSQEGVLAVWDIYNSKLKYSNALAHSAPITDVTFSPLCSDLVVTTGFDRKLMFFEMNSNKCVKQEMMERSPTCVDFCPDGKGLAVGLQNGTILTYDVRQMDKPMHTFTAHDAQIKQLLFQKKSLDKTSSYHLSEDKVEAKQAEINESNVSCNSLSHILKNDILLVDSPSEPPVDIQQSDTVDSFMDALGMNLNFTDDNSQHIQQLLDSKIEGASPVPHIQIASCESKQRNTSQSHKIPLINRLPQLLKNSVENIREQNCSTPKENAEQQKQLPLVSPIVSEEQNNLSAGFIQRDSQVNIREEMNGVREEMNSVKEELKALREQVKEVDETLKADIKYKYLDNMSFTRKHFLDLQMYLVKEFIKIEYCFDDVKQGGASEEGSEVEFLIQENMKLRQEMQELRQETQELRCQLANKSV